MQTVDVNLGDRRYSVYIGEDMIFRLGEKLRETVDAEKIAVITDKNVVGLYGEQVLDILGEAGFDPGLIVVNAGEKSKSLTTLRYLYKRLLDYRITRWDCILTLGGGVVGDLGGFTAATYLRGVPYIQVPTTLLAQIDSSIGGKVAVDLPEGKNLIGSFYHPQAVFIDPKLLDTLPDRFVSDGMAEVIKYGCIKDRALFESLQGHKNGRGLPDNIERIIFTCLDIKKRVVEEDQWDRGGRMVLNFGHTLGHAIEKHFNYDAYTHGEAVAIGMYQITKMSERLGITRPGTTEGIGRLLTRYHLPYAMPAGNVREIIAGISADKKRKGQDISVVLLEEIGKCFTKQVRQKEIHNYFTG